MSELIVKRRTTIVDANSTEVQAALTALALASGNATRASRVLEESGAGDFKPSTLQTWKNKTYKDEYRRVCEEIAPELQERMAQHHEALVQAAADLEWKAIERLNETIPDASVNEAANVYGKAAVNAGIHTDKAKLRRGEPTEIRQTLNVGDALKRLKAIAPSLVDVNPMLIESTAEEEGSEPKSIDPDLEALENEGSEPKGSEPTFPANGDGLAPD